MPPYDRIRTDIMTATVEVFADINCPFTHVGLTRVAEQLAPPTGGAEIRVRAWPIEWVNGSPLDAAATANKIESLRDQLEIDAFVGFRADNWPRTTIPALNLAASAYERDAATGLAVSLALRSALFEQGDDISDPAVLAAIAESFGLDAPPTEASESVLADYAEGQRRQVSGSPHFWVADHDYFCPSLDLGHDAAGELTARFDPEGLGAFISNVVSGS
jgi:predicted DsbA family dithiol-disulfide isomerase